MIYLTNSALSEYELFRNDKLGMQAGRDVRENKSLTCDRLRPVGKPGQGVLSFGRVEKVGNC